jgi:hypothetical protein
MKMLLDPIYTTFPSRCASASKYAKIWSYLAPKHPDLYAYWLIPDDIPEECMEWLKSLPHVERIQFVYTPAPGILDRYREYSRLPRELEMVYAIDGEYWDWDILVTNKSALVPLIRMNCCKPGAEGMRWAKKIVLLEDMPMMSYKSAVAIAPGQVSDQQTLLGYYQSDLVAICAFWQKRHMLKIARDHFSAAFLRRLQSVLVESSPIQVDEVQPKTKAVVEKVIKREKPFTISFSGRMVWGHRIEDIWDVMTKHWVMRNKEETKIRCMMTTASKGLGQGMNPPDFIEFHPAPREEFWRIVREESDVGLFLSNEEDYSLSLVEPLILGLPVAVLDCDWARATLGDEYPFYIKTPTEAYGVIRAFYEDYATHYKKFVLWQREKFLPLLQSRNDTWTPLVVELVLAQWVEEFEEWKALGKEQEMVRRAATYLQPQPEALLSLLQRMVDGEPDIRTFGQKLVDNQREAFRSVWITDWHTFRLQLIAHHNVRDAGPQVGVLQPIAQGDAE